jgi:aerobic carbon-monoxide dehydrogenase medium subunit
MYETIYHRASSIDDAAALFAKGEDAKFLAGGQTLLPVMKQRLASPSDVIDLGKIKDMIGIEATNAGILVKGATTHYDVAMSDAVKKAIPALASLASGIGDPAVRYRGTIGGSLANNDPAADYPAAALGLGATIHTSKRKIAADDFFKGMYETALAADEIITAVSFPVPKKAAYMKFPQPASRFALVGVFVAQTTGKGNEGVRVAVTGAASHVHRAKPIEDALTKSFTADAAKAVKIPAGHLNNDLHGSAEYRAHLVSVLAARAVAAMG